MADTALTLITDALLDLGVLADEETPTASQAVGGLRKLNNMIDAWNIQSLLTYGSTSNILPMVPNQGVYTVGTGGNLNVSRPNDITFVSVRDTSLPAAQQLDWPLQIYNDQEWQEMALKGLTSTWPNWGVWINWDFPLVKLYVNPIPLTSQYSLVVWTGGILGNLSQNTSILMPPGYKRALTANLCIELAGSYGVQVPETVQTIARDSVADLKVQNFQLNELEISPAVNPYVDFLTGYQR